MSIKIGTQDLLAMKIGTTTIFGVYIGTTKIWPITNVQRIDKNGSWSGYYNYNSGIVTGWTSNTTYPGTVTSDRYLTATTTGTGLVVARVAATATIIAGTQRTFTLYQNNTAIASQSLTLSGTASTYILAAKISVTSGDQFDVRLTAGPPNGGGGTTTVQATGTYLYANFTPTIQRIDKNGTFTATTASTNTSVTGWKVNSLYTGQVQSDTNLLITQAATYLVTFSVQHNQSTGTGTVRFLHDTTELYNVSGTTALRTLSTVRTVAANDYFYVTGNPGTTASALTIPSGSIEAITVD